MLRDLTVIEGPKGWDGVMPDHVYMLWKALFLVKIGVEDLVFARCIKSSNSVGNPSLIILCDASTIAFGCCAYIIRWQFVE